VGRGEPHQGLTISSLLSDVQPGEAILTAQHEGLLNRKILSPAESEARREAELPQSGANISVYLDPAVHVRPGRIEVQQGPFPIA
jgi:hypothetical protein